MKRSGFILGFLLLLGWVQAQTQDPFMRQLTVKDGLPQQQVMCYFKDSRGFLWLGTKGGLSRFDGKTFKNYDEEDGIPHNIVRNIGEDENGHIWFTTILGIVRFDGKDFKVHPNNTLGDASITIINSKKIIVHSDTWVLFENEHFISKADYFKGIDAKKVQRTYYDKPTGHFYVGYGDDIIKSVIYLYQNERLQKIGAPNLNFSHIQRLPNGTLLFGRFIGNTVEHETYLQKPDGTFSLLCRKNLNTLELFEVLPYDIYTGFVRQKPQYFMPKGQKGIFKPMLNPISEARFECNAFYELYGCNFYTDPLGYIWVDSEQGLGQIFNEAFEFIKEKTVNSAWAVTEDNKRHLYFSTLSTASIIKYDGQQFTTIFDTKRNPKRNIGFYYGASKDGNGNLYFPHHLGVLKYDGQQFSQLLPETLQRTKIIICIPFTIKNEIG